ncbi:MAG: glycosyltransferase family 39 protein [Anaerolineae bacterium]|nr:glycosyltransferase family 39 protein [Anaerolineae bacterium]
MGYRETLRNHLMRGERQRTRLARSFTLPLILLLAALLRFYQLAGQSLWADEGNSVALARRGFAEIVRRTAFDIHPPFYYWLLKIWTALFGSGEVALRSLSAVLGIGAVYLTWRLGCRLINERAGLIAAFLVAISPLSVYYSQETRMYMLLTFLGCLTVLLGLRLVDPPRPNRLMLAYIFTATAGLYTHYAYPVILIALNLAVLFYLIHPSPFALRRSQLPAWLGLQLIPLLFYLPWLPTAWRQLTTWPAAHIAISLREVLETISTTLLLGLSWPAAQGLLLTLILGLVLLIIPWPVRHGARVTSRLPYHSLLLLYLWFLLPISLTVIIFSPAFLKFLLVASPPLALLLALLIERTVSPPRPQAFSGDNTTAPRPAFPARYLIGGAFLLAISAASAVSLYHYYTHPAYARDNYRGLVNFVKAVGGPDDAVILHAEGQQDVFNYYFERDPQPLMPVYPLPRQRPPDKTATVNELQTIANNSQNIYAVYWATRQADPTGLIENWLNTNLYKATDQWYGNVRLVSYASPQQSLKDNLIPIDYRLGEHIRLTGYALSSTQPAPGEILQLALAWETETALAEPYTVFGQVLDPANHLVGQRDAPPLIPTSEWPVGESVPDAHGLFIEPGTPPGRHRLIVGLYHSETGRRLPVMAGGGTGGEQAPDFIELAEVEIIRRDTLLPPEAFNMQTPLNISLGQVTLLGYDLYKLGHRSTPKTPLHPGDPAHLVVYWLAHQPRPALKDSLTIQVVNNGGEPTPLSFTYPPAGVDYPNQKWTEGEIIRAQYDFFLRDLAPGIYRLRLTLDTTAATSPPVAVTQPFRVE